jgi:hypothetical protein
VTYWDWIRVANLVVLVALVVTIAARYRAGTRMLDPRNLLNDPSHLPLLRMGQILLYLALIEGFAEGLILGLPGGPRVIAPLPGFLLILLSAHWRRVYRLTQHVADRTYHTARQD